jgi:hypothetical protein
MPLTIRITPEISPKNYRIGPAEVNPELNRLAAGNSRPDFTCNRPTDDPADDIDASPVPTIWNSVADTCGRKLWVDGSQSRQQSVFPSTPLSSE